MATAVAAERQGNRRVELAGSGSLPRTGVVLIGTPGTLATLAVQVGALRPAPVIAGAVEVGEGKLETGSRDGIARLGAPEQLPVLKARLGLKAAVVCVSATEGKLRTRIEAALAKAGLAATWVPTFEELLDGRARIQDEGQTGSQASLAGGAAANRWQAAPVIDLSELIGRRPHAMDRDAVGRVLTGKRVLITGAGGSIGGELARVAAGFEPESLILMERGENALFEIDRQIGRLFPGIARKAVLHDVVDVEATLRHAMELRPHVVFHAAAHKHVPLMEDHPAHALTNNLFGTKSIADAAVAAGAERFVMISSDKAVNPTSVMGATKRLAEMYVHGLGPEAARAGTRLSMVRFGNVLGSAASVLTIWGQQIAEGGPVTITDPRMTRYFMTIPEAATLVVQSMAEAAKDAVGVFVLDMGGPIRIAELAARFVRAHGLWPRLRLDSGCGLDCGRVAELAAIFPPAPAGSKEAQRATIDVAVTGARPGEKLHEELAYAAEVLAPTGHPGVRSWGGPGFEASRAAGVREMVADLGAARFSRDRFEVLSAIRRHVPEMRPPSPPAAQTAHPSVG